MKNKIKNMEKALDDLLSFLCTNWGFCIDQESVIKIKESKHLKADEFACAILKAEGMNSEIDIEFKRKIKNEFIERFGNELHENDFNNAL